MIKYDFDQSIGYLLCTVWRGLENSLNEELRQHGVTYRQWQVLAWLALLGEAMQNQLAERMGIESATLVGVLDRMERDGWIGRHPHPTDRRKKIIRPTDQVEPVWETMVGCAHKVRSQAVHGVDPKELAVAWKVLEQIRDNVGSAPSFTKSESEVDCENSGTVSATSSVSS